MITPEVLILTGIALILGYLAFKARIVANELTKIGKLSPELLKLVKLRKPMKDFMVAATEGFKMPVQLAEMTEKHMEQIAVISQGAIMSVDLFNADAARRAASPAQAALVAGSPIPESMLGPVPLPNPPANGGVVKTTQTEQPAEIAPKLHPVLGQGANGGKIERVQGRVEMGPAGTSKLPSGDPPRDLALGAASGADGTAS